jgi:hypothetical protein
MIRRRALLGVLTAVVLSGPVSAKPPGESGPLSEGRELDPGVRDYFLPTPTSDPVRNRAPASPAEKRGDTVGSLLMELSETLLIELWVPLGIMHPDGAR